MAQEPTNVAEPSFGLEIKISRLCPLYATQAVAPATSNKNSSQLIDVASQKVPPVIPMFVIGNPELQASSALDVLYSAPIIITGVGVGVAVGVGVPPAHGKS